MVTLAAAHMLAAIVFSPLGGFVANLMGQRRCLVFGGILFLIGWILIAFSPNVPMLFAGRILTVVCAAGVGVSIGKWVFKC